MRRLHWRKVQVKVRVRLLFQSSRALLEIIPSVMRVSVRGPLWRAIHRVAEFGRRSGKECSREPVEDREKAGRRNPIGGNRGRRMPRRAANGVGRKEMTNTLTMHKTAIMQANDAARVIMQLRSISKKAGRKRKRA